MTQHNRTKTGYSIEYHQRVAHMLTENVSQKTYTTRLNYFKNKLERDKEFDNGINITMKALHQVAFGKKGEESPDKNLQFQAVNAMIRFLPLIHEVDYVDIMYKNNTAEMLKEECRKLSKGNDAVSSLARGTLESGILDNPFKSGPPMS